MNGKPMLSVERELLERLTENWNGTDARIELRALLDKPACAKCGNTTVCGKVFCEDCCYEMPAAQHQGEPVAYQRLWDALGEKPYKEKNKNNRMAWAKKFVFRPITKLRVFEDDIALYAEQPAPVADQAQCEECKGWGYHENHHEGGGTECGECGGSGNATVAVAVVMPDRMEVEPFTTIDRGSKNYKAGYNAALAEVARLNEVKP